MNCFESCSLISLIETIKSENDRNIRISLLNELHDNYLNNNFDSVSKNDERNIVECFIWECNNNGDYYNISSILKGSLKKYVSNYGFDNLVKHLDDRKLMIDVAVCLQLGCQYTDAISLYKLLIYDKTITEEELKYAVQMMYLLIDEPESMKVFTEKEHKLFQKYCKANII